MKTVKVKILVAIGPDGSWSSFGYSGCTDAKEWICLDDTTEPYAFRWIEADIPLPEEDVTITAESTPDK